jgi:hypothetical protein
LTRVDDQDDPQKQRSPKRDAQVRHGPTSERRKKFATSSIDGTSLCALPEITT